MWVTKLNITNSNHMQNKNCCFLIYSPEHLTSFAKSEVLDYSESACCLMLREAVWTEAQRPPQSSDAGAGTQVSFQARRAVRSHILTVSTSLSSTGRCGLSGSNWQVVNAPLKVWVAVVVDRPPCCPRLGIFRCALAGIQATDSKLLLLLN